MWSVAYYVPAERYWQFAGEGRKQWALERRNWLRACGHRTRIRRVHSFSANRRA